MRRYRGVAHVHSSYSFDGRLPLDEVARYLAGQGMDFVLMAEHVENMDLQKVRAFVHHCRQLSTSNFAVIPGIEIDALHALFYGIGVPSPWSCNEDLARQLAGGGALVVVSHPVKIRCGLHPLTKTLADAVEVWNSRHDGKIAIRNGVADFWTALMKEAARHFLPVCGVDFHDTRDFFPLAMEVESAALDQEAVLAGIRAARYRMLKASRPVPLDFRTGSRPASYRARAALYGAFYESAYFFHRLACRWNFRPPRALKSILRRYL